MRSFNVMLMRFIVKTLVNIKREKMLNTFTLISLSSYETPAMEEQINIITIQNKVKGFVAGGGFSLKKLCLWMHG